MQREAIIRGPAIVVWNSLTFYSQGDIKVTMEQPSFEVSASAFGKVADRSQGRLATIRFTPAGKWITGLWPYGATAMGASIYGATDRDLIIKPLDTNNNQWTFYNAAITKMPPIQLSASKTLIGEVELVALGKENTAPGTADSLFLRAANTFADTSFSPADLVTQPYAAAWGAVSGFTDIQTKAGWQVDFNLSLSDVMSDTFGVIDKRLTGLEVVAKCEPLTVAASDLMTALGIHKARGASLDSGNDLALTGTGVSLTVKNATIRKAEPAFGLEADLIGTLEFVAARKFTTGARDALFTVA